MSIAAQNGTVDKKPSIHQQLKIKVGATKRCVPRHAFYHICLFFDLALVRYYSRSLVPLSAYLSRCFGSRE